MSDDLNKKIKQITDMLGQESLPDNLKGLLSLLSSSGSGSEESPSKPAELSPFKEEKRERSELEENIDMVRKIKKVMDRVNSTHDPRVNLLMAIKPFLSGSRQRKVGSCIKLLQMTNLTKFVDDNDK